MPQRLFTRDGQPAGRSPANPQLLLRRRRWLTFGGGGRAGPAVLLADDFSEANGTNLNGKALDVGGTWTVAAGAWAVQSGRAAPNAGGARAIVMTGAAADITAAVTVNPAAAGGFVGLLVRYSDANNWWYVVFRAGDNAFRIIERNAGVDTTRASSTAVDYVGGNDYRLRAVCSGQTITATIDGANQIQYALATHNQAAIIVGLTGGDAADRLDDLQVTSP